MLKYVYVPFESETVYNTDFIFETLEEITNFDIKYAVLDALSLEYYFSIEFH